MVALGRHLTFAYSRREEAGLEYQLLHTDNTNRMKLTSRSPSRTRQIASSHHCFTNDMPIMTAPNLPSQCEAQVAGLRALTQ